MQKLFEVNLKVLKNIARYSLRAFIFLSLQTNSAWSFADIFTFDGHKSITKMAFEDSIADVAFSEDAIKDIYRANIDADKWIPSILGSPGEEYQHFDNEFIGQGSRYIKYLKLHVIGLLISNNEVTIDAYNFHGSRARKALGLAVHALQDFYSHTNWVDEGNTAINTDLGREALEAPPGSPTCDITHNNYQFGLAFTTSGYWEGLVNQCGPLSGPAGFQSKCRHGPPDSQQCGGLNKDSHFRENFEEAKSLAIEATRDYVQQIIDEIRYNSNLTDEVKNEAIRLLADQPSNWDCGCIPLI